MRSTCTKATNLYMLLLICLFPLFTGPDGYIMLGMKKYVLLLAITALWLLVLAAAIRKDRKDLNDLKGKRSTLRFLFVSVCVFFAGACLSAFTSEFPRIFSFDTNRYDGLLTYLIYCLLVLGIAVFAQPTRIFVFVFEGAYTVCCLIAFLQLCGLDPLHLFPMGATYYDPFIQENGKYLGTLGNIDLMSAYHCMGIPLAASFIAVSEKRDRFLLLIPLLLGTAVCLWTGVAGGILALSLSFVFFVPVILTRNGKLSPRKRAVAVIGSFLAVSALCLLAVRLIPFEKGSLHELHEILCGHIEDSYGSNRIGIWRVCLAAAGEHPLKGIGPDCLGEHIDVRFERYSVLLGGTLHTYTDNAHNEYLQFFLSFGLLGTLPAAAAAVCGTRTCIRRGTEPLIRILSAPLLACAIQAFFNIGSFITVIPFLCLWACIFTAAGSENDQM